MKYQIDLTGKSAVVTGASAGIGLGIAQALADCGAQVLVVGRNADAAQKAVDQICANGGQAAACAADVTSEADVRRIMETAKQLFGKIDLLYNNAGTISMSKVEDLSLETWENTFAVNCRGVFLCSREVIPYMKETGGGRIINIASQAGKTGLSLLTHYCASKGAVIAFTKGLALELTEDNIRVNSICPGSVMTDMTRREAVWASDINGKSPEQNLAEWEHAVPLGRYATPEDIANVAVFLASEMADYMTGQAINVSGGQEMH